MQFGFSKMTPEQALIKAQVPEKYWRKASRVYLTHDFYNIDELEKWKIEQLKIADNNLSEITERCRTTEQRIRTALGIF